jgi:UDP-N-acetylglucosamine pyrophosphorylase
LESLAVIILAAGKGTRMKSSTAKVLHCIREKPMIGFVVDQAVCLAGNNVVVVVGTQAELVKQVVSQINPHLHFAMQEKQLGTGHAVACALPELSDSIEHVLILCGDVPFIKASTLADLVDTHVKSKNVITMLAATIENPTGYGRLVVNGQNRVLRIVEQADANDSEKQIKLINTGIYCVNRSALEYLVGLIKSDNAQNEMYLTDMVSIAADHAFKMGMIECRDNIEILGINTPEDMERAEAFVGSYEKP